MSLLETAAATLIGGERRIETSARNVTNVNTPGFKREIAFTELLASPEIAGQVPAQRLNTSSVRNNAQSPLMDTGNPFDLAVDGPGYVLVRSGEQYTLTRGGQFSVGPDGTLTDALGRIVQQSAGGDLNIDAANPQILSDGTFLDDGVPIGAITLFAAPVDGGSLALSEAQAAALEQDSESELRQGMLESSNVVLSDEMIELMRAQRQVESGAQLVRAYDRLMNQAISTFSRSG